MVAGVPAKLGSAAFADFVPDYDDTVVTLLRACRDDQRRQDVDAGDRAAVLHRDRHRAAGTHAVGHRAGWPAGRAGARAPRWPAGSSRSPRAATVAARSASRPASAGWSGSRPRAGGSRAGRWTSTRRGCPCSARWPAPCATPRRSSTRPPVPQPGDPDARDPLPRRARPSWPGATATSVSCASAATSTRRSSPRSIRRYATRGSGLARCWPGSGHAVEDVAAPIPPEAVPHFETVWAVSAATALDPAGPRAAAAPADPVPARARRGGERPGTSPPRSPLLNSYARQGIAATAHLDAVLTPTLALLPRPVGWFQEPDGDPAEDFERQKRFTPVHRDLQHDRSAGDLAAAVLEPRGPADRRSCWSAGPAARRRCWRWPRSWRRPSRGATGIRRFGPR